MFKLVNISVLSKYIEEILSLLSKNREFIFFSDFENLYCGFLNDLILKRSKVIAGIKNDDLFGVLILKRFEKISCNKFICYIFGAGKRGYAKEIQTSLEYVFSDLKKQGCVSVRLETLASNRPMRNLAFRLGFRHVGEFLCGGMRKNKLKKIILYEKLL